VGVISRSQVFQHGLEEIGNKQLLELLLSYNLPQQKAKEAAHNLLEHFHSLSDLLEADLAHLQWVKGVDPKAAILIYSILEFGRRYQGEKLKERSTLETPMDMMQYVTPLFYGHSDQKVYLLCLDAKQRVLRKEKLAEGCVTRINISYRYAATVALLHKATKVIVAQNHPNGDANPSEADNQMNFHLTSAFRVLRIPILEHLIVGDDSAYLFSQRRHIKLIDVQSAS